MFVAGAFSDNLLLNIDGQEFILSYKVYSYQFTYVKEFDFEFQELATSICKKPVFFTLVQSVSIDNEKVYLLYFQEKEKPYHLLIDCFGQNLSLLKYYFDNDYLLSRFVYNVLYHYFVETSLIDFNFKNNDFKNDIVSKFDIRQIIQSN